MLKVLEIVSLCVRAPRAHPSGHASLGGGASQSEPFLSHDLDSCLGRADTQTMALCTSIVV